MWSNSHSHSHSHALLPVQHHRLQLIDDWLGALVVFLRLVGVLANVVHVDVLQIETASLVSSTSVSVPVSIAISVAIPVSITSPS